MSVVCCSNSFSFQRTMPPASQVTGKTKVTIVGDAGVGKTSIVHSFIHGKFEKDYQATIGVDFLSKTIHVEGKAVRFKIWDTAGQERFQSLIPNYIRDSDMVLLVYSIDNRESFDNTGKWVETIRNNSREGGVVIVLVANKNDLEGETLVTKEDGMKKARTLGVYFTETTAKDHHQATRVFELLAKKVLDSKAEENEKLASAGARKKPLLETVNLKSNETQEAVTHCWC